MGHDVDWHREDHLDGEGNDDCGDGVMAKLMMVFMLMVVKVTVLLFSAEMLFKV